MLGTISGLLSYFGSQNTADAQNQLSQTYELLGQMQYMQGITNAEMDKIYADLALGEKEKEKQAFLGAQEAAIGASGLTVDSYKKVVSEATYNYELEKVSITMAGEVSAFNKYMEANIANVTAQLQSAQAQQDADNSDLSSWISLIQGINSDLGTAGSLMGGK